MKKHFSPERILRAEIPGATVLAARQECGVFRAGDGQEFTDLPSFYRILLEIRSGRRGLSHTEIWLPDDWNGILLCTGNGGMAGRISRWAFPARLRQGYALANTDMGTCAGRESGIANPDVWADFGWRATHLMTHAAKTAVRGRYGRDADRTYFVGASTGGQQALAAAQRFPQDYDGIIAGVPANNRTLLHTYFLWNHVALCRPDGRALFGTHEIERITDAATRFFRDSNGGAPDDNFIALPRADRTEDLLAALRDALPALTQEQTDALRAVYNGPVNPRTGERIYNGMPVGSEIYGCGIADCQGAESPHYYPFIWAFGADVSPWNFDFDRDIDRLNDLLAPDLNANNPDLSAFRDSGGKLLLYSGSADPCVPFPDAMRYYERVAERMGGYEEVCRFCRYFLIPGRDHGAGGRGANDLRAPGGGDELDILRAWRETGAAPDFLLARRLPPDPPDAPAAPDAPHNVRPVWERPIHPYGSAAFPFGLCPPACSDRYLDA